MIHTLLPLSLILIAHGGPSAPAREGPARSGRQDRLLLLRTHARAGDLLEYELRATAGVTLAGARAGDSIVLGQITMEQPLRLRTLGVRPDGTAVLEITTGNGRVTAFGSPASLPAGARTVLEADRLGRIVRAAQAEPLPLGPPELALLLPLPNLGIVLPEQPVRTGETWTADVLLPANEKKARLVSTLLGLEMVEGAQTLKIRQSWTIPLQVHVGRDNRPAAGVRQSILTITGNVKVDSTLHLQESSGRLVKSLASFSGQVVRALDNDPGPDGSGQVVTTLSGQVSLLLRPAHKAAAILPPGAGAPHAGASEGKIR